MLMFNSQNKVCFLLFQQKLAQQRVVVRWWRGLGRIVVSYVLIHGFTLLDAATRGRAFMVLFIMRCSNAIAYKAEVRIICYNRDFCEAQGKGRAKGRPRKVTQRSFIDGGWWMVGWLACWFVGRSVGWVVGRSVGRLV